MNSPTEGERDSLLRDVNSSTGSGDSAGLPEYGFAQAGDMEGGDHNVNWEFAGYGTETVVENLIVDEKGFDAAKAQKHKHALGQLVSTAISGTFRLFISPHFSAFQPLVPSHYPPRNT